MNGTPVAGWKASPKTFRWPSVYTGEPGIGLSAGIEPSARTRRTFPDRLALSCAFPGIEASPVVMNRVPSSAKARIPPSWSVFAGIPSRTTSFGGGPGGAVGPNHHRMTRFIGPLVVVLRYVWYA